VIGFRDRCPPAAWASGLGILVTMVLDVSENLLMMGSLGLAGTPKARRQECVPKRS